MAEGPTSSLVTFLLLKVDDFLGKEIQLSKEMKANVSKLRRDLESLVALMKDSNRRGEHNYQDDLLKKEVRDVAYDIEDVLAIYALHLVGQSGLPFITQFFSRHSVDGQIQEVDSKLGQAIKRYNEIHNLNSSPNSAPSPSAGKYTYFPPRIAPLFMADADVVGFEEQKQKIISWTLSDQGRNQRVKVLFVVGMGGSGKTSLAKKVFDTVKQGFNCHAWITLSRSKKNRQLLWTIFNQICNPVPEPEPAPQNFSQFNEVELINKLQRHLKDKRYIIVLDDLWIRDVWEFIKYALPKDNHGRVIITTRRGDIAHAYRDNISTEVFDLPPLPLEKAQELFYRKTFPPNGICPSGLVGWSQSILKRCQGLPLAIIEIGQFLSNREKTESEWKKLHDGLGSVLNKNGHLFSTLTVLSVSYDDLPYHLKDCFLYLSIFPEDYPVNRRKLIRLWIAEGFIIKETGKEVEDIGEDYLKELIQRSLIQVCELDFDGKPRSCRVHNLMHKIILSKSREANFCSVLAQSERNFDESARRLSIQGSVLNMSPGKLSNAKARTFFTPGVPYCSIAHIPSGLKLLRVLHLEGVSLKTFPNEILELVLLKYLCLSNTNIKEIPKSLGNLLLLETLDLKQTGVTQLPKKILELDNLRHLLVYRYDIHNYISFDCVKGFDISTKIRTPDFQKLQKLQKLAFIKADRHPKMIRGLGSLTQLRKLGIIDLPSEEGSSLCRSIDTLQNLHSLNVSSLEKEPLNLLDIVTPPRLLQRLYLKGRLERFPTWTCKLHDLLRIRLKWSKLGPSNDPIEHLQDLPNLLELQLLDAYLGYQLEFRARKFQKLKILELEQLEQLRMVTMEKSTLPCLQKLIIKCCNNLEQVPVGIHNLTCLEELLLCDMKDNFVDPLKKNGVLRPLVQHIPRIHCYYRQKNWIREDL